MKGILVITFVIAAIALLLTRLIKSLGAKASPYLIFAIVDIAIGLIILGFALLDFKISAGEFAGIMGQLALIIGEPIVAGLLIIDVIVWLVKKKRN